MRYGDELRLITKHQLAQYDYFADFVPSVYIRFSVDGTEKDFFLEYVQGSKPFFTIVRRLQQYIKFAESGDWEAGTSSDLPKVLLICDEPSLQKRLIKKSPKALEDVDDDLSFFITGKDGFICNQ